MSNNFLNKISGKGKRLSKTALALLLVLMTVFSSLSLLQIEFFQTSAASALGQTQYDDITDFQKSRWAQIQNAIFKGTGSTTVRQPGSIMNKGVRDDNAYFNWTDTGVDAGTVDGVDKWDGTATKPANISNQAVTYDGSGVEGETLSVTYRNFHVDTAEEFRWILQNFATQGYEYVKVNLRADLDMSGDENVLWDSIEANFCQAQNFKRYLYIEGNGHTIYNLKIVEDSETKGAGLFSAPPAFLVVKNLGFQSSMVMHTDTTPSYNCSAGLIAAFAPQKFYFYNVHSNGAYMQISDEKNAGGAGGIGGLIGRKDIFSSSIGITNSWTIDPFRNGDTGDCFMENCSTKNYYMYGSDHIGGICSFMGMRYDAKYGDYQAKIPDTPEQYVFKNVDYSGTSSKAKCDVIKIANNYYPTMLENTYSVDCTIFSTGHDSGAFISCGHGFIANNCFTNNIIYATDNTGGFIGRSVNIYDGNIKDANGHYTIGNYFRNCFSTGIVEGSTAMGGFIGLDNSRRARSNIYTADGSGGDITLDTDFYDASTVYENCYSTAMVGMDYAGKYCGGFIGLDENYNKGLTGSASDGTLRTTVNYKDTTVRAYGSIYMNCYAAGEVGNVLTVTETDPNHPNYPDDMEDSYFKNDENENKLGEVLQYYPTGGFAGAVGLDIYYFNNYVKKADRTTNQQELVDMKESSSFYNCYYDMQTTAMHEMAVGLEAVRTYRDSAPNSKFQLTGVTGLYTQDSDVKKLPGLTGFPKSYKVTDENGDEKTISFRMDNLGTDSTTWIYNEEYYPQLAVFMSSDTTYSDITQVTEAEVEDNPAVTGSEFYIPTVVYKTDRARISYPVKSKANPDNDTLNTKSHAAQLAGVVEAYRYSQASTSTVLLNHWDYTMDTESGETEGEANWQALGLPQNRMVLVDTVDEEGNPIEEWQVSYENMAAGEYQFKIQAGQSWSYNYGRTKFNDTENITLSVPSDDCDVTIRFHYVKLKSSSFYVKADITDANGIKSTYTLTEPQGGGYQIVPYTVAGGLPTESWNANQNSLYTMEYMGDEQHYKLTIKDLPAGQYSFKITDGKGWSKNWGLDGIPDGGNMQFTVNETADVTIIFDESTKKCTVEADETKVTGIITGEKVIDFSGFSVITSSNQITGYEWLATSEGKELEACKAGEMTYNRMRRQYLATFYLPVIDGAYNTSNVNKNYAYKVIKDGVDEGANHGFYVAAPEDESVTHIPITFAYNELTGEHMVWSEMENVVKDTIEADSYSVIGVKELTGYNWMDDGLGSEAAQAGQMWLVSGSDVMYEAYFYDVKPGTLAFKVVPDCLDGQWNSPITYGDREGDNFTFVILSEYGGNTIKDADVHILFNAQTGEITVETTPANALYREKYVLMGTENLMGSYGRWNINEPVMSYDSETDLYYFYLNDIPVNDDKMDPSHTYLPSFSYAYRVIPQGVDEGGENNILRLSDSGLATRQATYDLKFEYDPFSGVTTVYAYDDNGEDVTSGIVYNEVEAYFYSVIGDQSLTGYDWDVSKGAEAATDGKMEDTDGDGVYEKQYTIKVPNDGSSTQYSFKVAANGTFNSGMSWGPGGYGDNSNYVVSVSSADTNITTATLYIYFNPETGEIWHKTDPENVNDADPEDSLTWYCTGVPSLRSNNSYEYDVTVYDTVRDITSSFTFTCGQKTEQRGLTWAIDSDYNTASLFESSHGFNMNYKQEGNTIYGTFNDDIVDLKVRSLREYDYTGPHSPILAQYYVEKFMPGKQWLKVTTAGYGYSSTFMDWKDHYLQYTDYLNKKATYDHYFSRYMTIIGKEHPYPGSVAGFVTEANILEFLEEYPEFNSNIAQDRLYMPKGVNLLTMYEDMMACPRKTPPDNKYPDVSNQSIVGSRNIRLIPTAYLESGNDAKINVIQSEDDSTGATATNIVRYDSVNSEDGTSFTVKMNDKKVALENQVFTYYNFAVTAGYLITDKIGLGIYNNYADQTPVAYKKGLVRNGDDVASRNSDDDGTGKGHRYFSMFSAYNNSTGLAENQYTDGGSRETANLKVDSFVDLSMIGSSRYNTYSYEETVPVYDASGADTGETTTKTVDVEEKAQTIVKIFKQSTTNDGQVELTLVNTDPDNPSSEYGMNYLKWTGQEKFVADDAGKYTVMFYWTLSDGRYLTDSKEVEVAILEPGLKKYVDTEYDSSGKTNTLKYTVSYTNERTNENLSFAILDVLPFAGSTRTHTNSEGVTSSGTTKDYSGTNIPPNENGYDYQELVFNIESMSIAYSNPSTVVKGIYYSTDKGVRDFIDTSNGSESALKLGLSEGAGLMSGEALEYFDLLEYNTDNERLGVLDDGISFSPGDRYNKIDAVTALAITGVELGIGENITFTFNVTYNGDPQEYLVNDAAYYVESMVSADTKSYDNCNPVVTAIVSRDIEGYAWLDSNHNGIVDVNEGVLEGMTVKLYKYENDINGNAQLVDTGLTTVTDKTGLYEFVNLPAGNYVVKFVDGGTPVTVIDGNGNKRQVNFSDMHTSPTKTETEMSGEFINSRNLFKGVTDENDKLVSADRAVTMPQDNQVYHNTYPKMVSINSTTVNYLYEKTMQNAAFYIDDYTYSIEIEKVNQREKPIAGVGFMLEYKVETDIENDDGSISKQVDWYPVYYTGEGDNRHAVFDPDKFKTKEALDNEGIDYIATTDEAGYVAFENLFAADYRFTEVNTPEGVGKLTSSIYFSLPYAITEEQIAEYEQKYGVKLDDDPDTYREIDGVRYYNKLKYKVTNPDPQFKLPITGNSGLFIAVVIGLALLGGAFALFILSGKKKKAKHY